jgi:hypothetical protein
MEGAMTNRNTHSTITPAALIGWMMERVYDLYIDSATYRMDSAMYRMAPTRKM